MKWSSSSSLVLITIWSGWMNSSWHLLHSDCWLQSSPLEDQERKISSIIERGSNPLVMVIQIVQAMLSSPNCLLRLETASLWQNVGIALSDGIILHAHPASNCIYWNTKKAHTYNIINISNFLFKMMTKRYLVIFWLSNIVRLC